MKKLLAMLCMITCIFGLTACGGEEEVSQMVTTKTEIAEALAVKAIAPTYTQFMVEGEAEYALNSYTAEELAYVMEVGLSAYAQQLGFDKITFDSAGVVGSINSFDSAYDTMGAIISYDEPETVVKGNEMIVTVPVTGEKKDGNVEVIFNIKRFLSVEACTLNAEMTMGEMMSKAGLNTLLGMGTVFTVLVLIMAIIYAFGIIPKMQKKAADKKAAKANNTQAEVSAPVAAPVVETVAENLTDDLELVAVIAAAIAASEGAASTDGFVVRSIRRANRR